MSNEAKPKTNIKPGYKRMTYELSEKALAKVGALGDRLDIANSDVVDAAILSLNTADQGFLAEINRIKAERETTRRNASKLRTDLMEISPQLAQLSPDELSRLIAQVKSQGVAQ